MKKGINVVDLYFYALKQNIQAAKLRVAIKRRCRKMGIVTYMTYFLPESINYIEKYNQN